MKESTLDLMEHDVHVHAHKRERALSRTKRDVKG